VNELENFTIVLYINYQNRLILVIYEIFKRAKFDKNVIVWYNKEVVFKKRSMIRI